MANTTNSTNMLLPIPTVGVETGPQWATDIDNCLTIIDSHDHSPGKGVTITPAGINISSDLSFNNNNLTNARSLRLSIQPSVLSGASDLGCLYEVGVDLYYNDGNGNHVRLTQSGAVAGSPGSISNLTSPASASYVSANSTFVWQSAVNTPANMDGGSFILRNLTANSHGLTLSPPAAMGSDFTITLPSLPAQTNFLTMDTSGNIAAAANVDNSTLQFSTNVLSIKDSGVTFVKRLPRPTADGVAANVGEYELGAAQTITITSSTFQDTGHTATITTHGGPVFIGLKPIGTSTLSVIEINGNSPVAQIQVLRGSTVIGVVQYAVEPLNSSVIDLPPGIIWTIDSPAAGTYTYKLQAKVTGSGGNGVAFTACNLIAYEL